MAQYGEKLWAGIDCSGLVQRAVNQADKFKLAIPGTAPAIWGNPDDNDIVWSGPMVVQCGATVGTCSNYTHYIPYTQASAVKTLKKLRRGDVVSYTKRHVSLIYSDRPTCVDDNDVSTCTYEIVHASGADKLCYVQDQEDLPDNCSFNRKVVVNMVSESLNSSALKNPKAFGRINLWN